MENKTEIAIEILTDYFKKDAKKLKYNLEYDDNAVVELQRLNLNSLKEVTAFFKHYAF